MRSRRCAALDRSSHPKSSKSLVAHTREHNNAVLNPSRASPLYHACACPRHSTQSHRTGREQPLRANTWHGSWSCRRAPHRSARCQRGPVHEWCGARVVVSSLLVAYGVGDDGDGTARVLFRGRPCCGRIGVVRLVRVRHDRRRRRRFGRLFSPGGR
eukprot:2178696-Prymnesium_polylepis.1